MLAGGGCLLGVAHYRQPIFEGYVNLITLDSTHTKLQNYSTFSLVTGTGFLMKWVCEGPGFILRPFSFVLAYCVDRKHVICSNRLGQQRIHKLPKAYAGDCSLAAPPLKTTELKMATMKKPMPMKSAGKKSMPMESKKEKMAEMAAMKKGGGSKAMMSKGGKGKC